MKAYTSSDQVSKFKVGDIFFYKYSNNDWVVGKITKIMKGNRYSYASHHFDILETVKGTYNVYSFDYKSFMYNHTIKLDSYTDVSDILAMIL